MPIETNFLKTKFSIETQTEPYEQQPPTIIEKVVIEYKQIPKPIMLDVEIDAIVDSMPIKVGPDRVSCFIQKFGKC